MTGLRWQLSCASLNFSRPAKNCSAALQVGCPEGLLALRGLSRSRILRLGHFSEKCWLSRHHCAEGGFVLWRERLLVKLVVADYVDRFAFS